MILAVLADLALAVALGAHVAEPWRLARAEAGAARLWARLAAPALLTSALLSLLALGLRLDAALAWGLATPFAGGAIARSVALTFAALLAIDLVLLVGWRRIDASGWRAAAAVGAFALLAAAVGRQQLQIGVGPEPPAWAWALAALAWTPGAWLAGRLLVGRQAAVGASLLAAAGIAVEHLLRHPFVRGHLTGHAVTALAAVLLVALSSSVPPRFRRVSLLAGLALAAWLAVRTADVSAAIGDALSIGAPIAIP